MIKNWYVRADYLEIAIILLLGALSVIVFNNSMYSAYYIISFMVFIFLLLVGRYYWLRNDEELSYLFSQERGVSVDGNKEIMLTSIRKTLGSGKAGVEERINLKYIDRIEFVQSIKRGFVYHHIYKIYLDNSYCTNIENPILHIEPFFAFSDPIAPKSTAAKIQRLIEKNKI